MPNRLTVLAIVLLCAVSALADYIPDREAAVKLVGDGKHEEALAAFRKMAESAASDFQKSDALEQAALCAQRLKREDEAMDIARNIPLPPVSKTVQMRLMMAKRMWKEVVAQFKDEDIDHWPDYAASEAFHLRGKAHHSLNDPKSAAKDMEKALECAGSDGHFKAVVLGDLGSVCVSLQDDAKALAAYLKAQSCGDKGFHAYLSAVIARANILRRQGKHEDALRELEKNDLAHLKGYWRCETLRAYASVLASQGKKADALARYTEALKVEDIHPSQKSACEKAIKELAADAK
ncbi:MAG: hypothetical protein FJ272_14945 [Planctomycetes bacterium]|nr:hypothetical protein [Planctomycetota bacterium]